MIQKIKIAIALWGMVIILLVSGCCASAEITTQLIPTETAKIKSEDSKTFPNENIGSIEESEDVEINEEISKDLRLKHTFTIFKFVGKRINEFCKDAKFTLFFIKISTNDLTSELFCIDIKSKIPLTSADGVIHTETFSPLENFNYLEGKLTAEIIITFNYLEEAVKISENKLVAMLKRLDESDFVATFTIKLTQDISVQIECNLTSDLIEGESVA